MRVGDLIVDSHPWLHVDVDGLTAVGRHAPQLRLALTLRPPAYQKVELRNVVVSLVVDEKVVGEGHLTAETVDAPGRAYTLVIPTTRQLLAYATERLGRSSSIEIQLRWRGPLRLFVGDDVSPPRTATEPTRGRWTDGRLANPAPVQVWTMSRHDWRKLVLRPTGVNDAPSRPAVRTLARRPSKWIGGIALTAAAGLLLQLFTGVFGQWWSVSATADELRPGPDIFASAETIDLDDEGRSTAMAGDFQPDASLRGLLAQPGAAASPQFRDRLRANGGVNVDTLSIRLVVQGKRNQQVRIVGISPDSLHRAAPLAGTIFNVPPQAGAPTMRMIFNLDEVNPVARNVGSDETSGQGTKDTGAFFGDTTITLHDGEQEVIVIRATTAHFYATFNLKIDYLVGTTKKSVIVTNHGRPFRVTGEHCGATPGTLDYQRSFTLQGDFSLTPDSNPHHIPTEPACHS